MEKRKNMKIVVLEAASIGRDVSWDGLKKFGELVVHQNLEQDMVKDAIKDADIIVPNKLIIDRRVLDGSSVKMVCEAATGYNNVDVDYCKQEGIRVTNVSGYSTESVAQHTLALLLCVYEHLDYYCRYVESGEYTRSKKFSHVERPFHEIAGKTWGVVGLGAIGKQTARLARVFGADVIYYSASGNSYDVPYQRVDFDELLEKSDIISVHCPLNEKTEGLFQADAFKKMKNSAVLINVARGPVIDNGALAEALKNNEIAAAGLDVFEEEPIADANPLNEIKDRDRLIMTPHIGWGTIEARTRLLREVELNIEAFLNHKERNIV